MPIDVVAIKKTAVDMSKHEYNIILPGILLYYNILLAVNLMGPLEKRTLYKGKTSNT